MCELRLTRPYEGVYLIEAESQYMITSTFMRLQEYYESPMIDIRKKVFSIERYMDRYAEEYGNFTYTTDWNGFNVPGYVVQAFFNDFSHKNLLKKEKLLKSLLQDVLKNDKPFYVIGIHKEKSEIEHELAHSFYYLDINYKIAMNDFAMFSLSKKIRHTIFKELKKMGYDESVLLDELQAYLATSSFWYLWRKFGFSTAIHAFAFKKIFEEYKGN